MTKNNQKTETQMLKTNTSKNGPRLKSQEPQLLLLYTTATFASLR